MKKSQIETHYIFTVDFKNKKLLNTKSFNVKVKVQPKITYDFTNFNEVPVDSNFKDFSAQERMEYADHVLKHIKEASFADLVHWANMGMVDMVKVSKALGIDITTQNTKKKKQP